MIFLSRDFKQIKINLDYLITYNITCLGIGRSCLLLRRFTSQVVSTPSKDLSLAWLALNPRSLSRIQPIIRYTFLYKGDSLYGFPLCLHSTNPPCFTLYHTFSILSTTFLFRRAIGLSPMGATVGFVCAQHYQQSFNYHRKRLNLFIILVLYCFFIVSIFKKFSFWSVQMESNHTLAQIVRRAFRYTIYLTSATPYYTLYRRFNMACTCDISTMALSSLHNFLFFLYKCAVML